MSHTPEYKIELMKRIDTLVEESCSLSRTRESWRRHVEIQAEIMRLCRQVSDLHGEDEQPCWLTIDPKPESLPAANPHVQAA